MKIRIQRNRYASASGYTVGRLYLEEGGYFCDTLEPEDRGLHQDMPLDQIRAKKVAGKTAVPKGTYEVKVVVSPSLKDKYYAKKYGGMYPCLLNVPGFRGVLIHPGNTAPGTPGATKSDTRGCILPGVNREPGRVSDSVLAYQDLMDFYIWPAHLRGERIWLTIE